MRDGAAVSSDAKDRGKDRGKDRVGDPSGLRERKVLLLMIVLNPFATRMLTARGKQTLDAHALRFGFYALLQVLASAALFAILRHMTSHGQAPDAPPRGVTNMTWTSYGMMLGFGLSIPVFFATTYAWLLWIIIPILVARLRRLEQTVEP